MVAAIAVVLATYAAVYHREGGPTYRQWKWVTFFIPLFVAAAISLVGLAVLSLPGRAALLQRAGPFVFAAYAAIVLLFSAGAGFPLDAYPAYLQVTLDEINLQYSRATHRASEPSRQHGRVLGDDVDRVLPARRARHTRVASRTIRRRRRSGRGTWNATTNRCRPARKPRRSMARTGS